MKIRREFLVVSVLGMALFLFSYFEIHPVKAMMDWRATRNATGEHKINLAEYQVYDHADGDSPVITIDFLKGKHFWHPQIAIWIEDSNGRYLETLLVTTSTARGLFYAGRSASNFRETDGIKTESESPTRRVDALPYWSHKRNHQYPDGLYSPPPHDPLPDAITGATPKENFYFRSALTRVWELTSFRVLIEVNVAFDENEFYSEYDFPDDSLYHGGTGLLGQPSLVYGATISKSDSQRYYLLSLLGHGHHSGSSGELVRETETISTAKYIVERIVLGVDEEWYAAE